MWYVDPFTIIHTVHPLVDELLFLCLIERIARSEQPWTGLGIDTPLCLLLQPLQLCISERREKACLGRFLPNTEGFFRECLLLHSLVAQGAGRLMGTPMSRGLAPRIVIIVPGSQRELTQRPA
jgi:hypothetical protein